MTSAPKSDSTVAAAGAAIKLAQSRTLSPSKMPRSMETPVIFRFISQFFRHCEERSDEAIQPCCTSVALRQQRGVAAGRGGVHGDGLLGGESRQIMRAAGLRAG